MVTGHSCMCSEPTIKVTGYSWRKRRRMSELLPFKLRSGLEYQNSSELLILHVCHGPHFFGWTDEQCDGTQKFKRCRYQHFFFRYEIFSIPITMLFSSTKFFRYPFRDFSGPNFSNTCFDTTKKMKICGTGTFWHRYVTLCWGDLSKFIRSFVKILLGPH